MSRVMFTIALVWNLTPLDAPAGPGAAPAERLKALRQDIDGAQARFRAAWSKLPDPRWDDPEVEKLYKAFQQKQQEGFAAALDIAKAGPAWDTSFDALEWLLTNPGAYHHPAGKAALELMLEYHALNPKVGKAVAILSYYPPYDVPAFAPAGRLLKAVAEKNPDRTTRGQAALGLAWLAKTDFQVAESKAAPEAERLAAAAEKALERVLRDYGDCPSLRGRGVRPSARTLGDEVKTDLYELRNLRISRPAPDIAGVDLGGTSFKLSDYRGQVTLLLFWASWCGPCIGAVPHERELVEHFKGRPFVLIGVNGDQKKEDATKAVDKHRIPWRSFWNGADGPGGPIAVAWNVRGWPRVYVIDHQGVIRAKYLHGKRLDELLEKLVAQAEAEAKGSGR
jgi:thiol-disulfide isomerase/thioredoxin/cytochrome c556